MENLFNSVTSGKKQSDGAFSVALGKMDLFTRHQIQVEVSATPTAGTLAVAVRSPGATDYVTVSESIDMTSTDLIKIITGFAFVSDIRFTPSGFDADKTYNVIINSR